MNFETVADHEPVSARFDRQAAGDLLAKAIADSTPLRTEIRAGLTGLLNVLAASESRHLNPDAFERTADGEQRDQPFHGAAWRELVGRYRELLAEVEEGGVTAELDARIVAEVARLAAAGQTVSAAKLLRDNSRMTHEEVRAYVERVSS